MVYFSLFVLRPSNENGISGDLTASFGRYLLKPGVSTFLGQSLDSHRTAESRKEIPQGKRLRGTGTPAE